MNMLKLIGIVSIGWIVTITDVLAKTIHVT